MGYVGTVCDAEVEVRSNLCEWLNDDMTAGHVSTIEIICLQNYLASVNVYSFFNFFK